MIFSFLNIWTIFLFVTIVLGIYVFIYLNLFGGIAEIKWKFLYLFLSWFFTIIYLFFEVEVILENFSFQLGDLLIIKDLQDLINLSLDIVFWLSFWFVFPILIFNFWTFFLHLWNIQERQSWGLFISLILYFFILFKFFLDTDLFLASWEFFRKTIHGFYDFQPDFYYIILSYLGDFMDLSKFFLLILCLFFLLFLFQSKIQKYCVTFIFFYIRLCFGFLFSFAVFYFFGGESVLRDSFLFGITFFCLEIYFFIYLFFFILKQKKNY